MSELGYEVAVFFDHSLSRLDSLPLEISRLLVDAEDPPRRVAALIAGSGPLAWSVAERILRRLGL